jgi:flagellin-like hook-associated protein FlgL
VNTSASGAQANGTASSAKISSDGRYVAFDSAASNLVEGDTNSVDDVFLKDMLTGEITRVSTNETGLQGNGSSTLGAFSIDGRYIAVTSLASNLVTGDTNARSDVFLKELATGRVTRVSTDSAGNQGNAGSTGPSLSDDGRFVLFSSEASNLISNDTNSEFDAFVKDLITGETKRVSTFSDGSQMPTGHFGQAISADGRYIFFSDGGSKVKDLLTGVTRDLGQDNNGNSIPSPNNIAAVSADGRKALISSSSINFATFEVEQTMVLQDLSRVGIQQMSGMVVSNRASAGVTLNLVQNYRTELLQYRANIGASTLRMQSFASNLGVISENFKSAESRIVDTDIAAEAAQSIRLQILRQSATSLLRQANLAPQIALELLRDS